VGDPLFYELCETALRIILRLLDFARVNDINDVIDSDRGLQVNVGVKAKQ
jgi:hypothetical protein